MTQTLKLTKVQIITINQTLQKERRIRLTGLGTFEIRKMKGRKLFHNFSGKIITIPTHNKLHFTPSATIKKYI